MSRGRVRNAKVEYCSLCNEKVTMKFSFPTDPIRQQVWLTELALGKWREETIAPQLVYRRYGICQRHFKAEDILLNAGPQGRPRLKKDAIPLPYRQAKVKVQDSSSEVNSQESVKPLADVEPDISQLPLNGSPSEPSVPKELLEKKIDFKTAL